jgi:hypothetical protein
MLKISQLAFVQNILPVAPRSQVSAELLECCDGLVSVACTALETPVVVIDATLDFPGSHALSWGTPAVLLSICH